MAWFSRELCKETLVEVRKYVFEESKKSQSDTCRPGLSIGKYHNFTNGYPKLNSDAYFGK